MTQGLEVEPQHVVKEEGCLHQLFDRSRPLLGLNSSSVYSILPEDILFQYHQPFGSFYRSSFM
jgi:hypothetical protein